MDAVWQDKLHSNTEMTFRCTVEVYTIADSTSENGGIQKCQHIRSSELHKTPIYSRFMIKNTECHKRETTDNHVLQQNDLY